MTKQVYMTMSQWVPYPSRSVSEYTDKELQKGCTTYRFNFILLIGTLPKWKLTYLGEIIPCGGKRTVSAGHVICVSGLSANNLKKSHGQGQYNIKLLGISGHHKLSTLNWVKFKSHLKPHRLSSSFHYASIALQVVLKYFSFFLPLWKNCKNRRLHSQKIQSKKKSEQSK